ncbi:MAG TPA: helicase-related protein [Flavipsychrobacter sp.]|nr:helicase-related protein [Flavipsychrobacter sp.]
MIEQKRKALEIFIREQAIGPGAIGNRFADLSEQSTLSNNENEHSSELLNIVPGGIYSTGILFPVDDTKGDMHANEHLATEDSVAADQNSGTSENEDEDNESDNEDDDTVPDQQSLNQMYPNTMGITVCLDQKVRKEDDLELVISGRYYTKIDLKHEYKRMAVLLEQDVAIFGSILQSLPEMDVIRTSIKVETSTDGKHYISYAGDTTTVLPVKKRIYELKRQRCDVLKVGEIGNYRSLDALKEGLFDKLKNKVIPTSSEGEKIVEKLKQIEQLENALAHILDLINIYDAKGYGVWKCETFERTVPAFLPDIDLSKPKQIFSYSKYKETLADIYKAEYSKGKWASLSVNLQYSKRTDTDGERIFMKVQLVNTSSHFDSNDTKNGRNFFSLASEEVNKRCFFGVGIRVSSKYLLPYRDLSLKGKEQFDEEDINRYTYRQYKDYGIGHSCSVKWSCNEGLHTVSTEYIPTCETPDIDPTPRLKNSFERKGTDGSFTPKPIFENTAFFQFKWLSTLSNARDEEVITGLSQFVDAYREWIVQQQDKDNPNIAAQIREDCKKDEVRIRKNIQYLSSNKEQLRSFRLMNTAMFMQLWHSVKKNRVHSYMTEEGFEGFFETFYRQHADDMLFSEAEHAAWRPFQLAFILLNIDGIFQQQDDPQWRARNEWVDLVWFPTGGGKTEAYLGLIALTILYRRITYGVNGGGTAVIMRYTLRLLTAQQFQRATFLIMALELIRRWDVYGLGNEPIYIGLYVGQGSLPNKLRDGDDSLLSEYKKLKEAKGKGTTRTKIQVRKCPCCGHPLNPVKYADVNDPTDTFYHGRILLSCSDTTKKCAFHYTYGIPAARKDQGPIPVSMCDEEIYQHPPALLFGTVDKFAQIAHKISSKDDKRNADSRRLFGKGNWEKGKPKNGYLPPDMIIQDELHLMMGPLGSAVALFESAIDQLCTREENGISIRPKVISSTATTRNTDLQIMALFDRKVNIFPKQGIDCDDSFFAFYKRARRTADGKDTHYLSKRRYIGILPTGRTQMWMQLRLAAILFTHRAVFEAQQLGSGYATDPTQYSEEFTKAIDYYHTVLTYFNSLREVGKTESQIFTYLIKETRRVFNKVLRPDKLMHCYYTYASCFHTGELTGRLSGEEVVEQMSKIGTAWSPDKRLAHGSDDTPDKGSTPPDFVIATNMISVGIDISRFNSMIINCMPRNIAEYIQASSRVARDKEGLVITVHHPFRSRDISHYEKFIEFHEKMYSYVEPISITPFTRKALERYLSLYIATILRHTISQYVDREGANVILSENEKKDLTNTLHQYFKNRERLMQNDALIKDVIKELLTEDNLANIDTLIQQAIDEWQQEKAVTLEAGFDLVFNNKATNIRNRNPQKQLYVDMDEYSDNIHSELWRIPQSLRVVDPEAVIHVEPK